MVNEDASVILLSVQIRTQDNITQNDRERKEGEKFVVKSEIFGCVLSPQSLQTLDWLMDCHGQESCEEFKFLFFRLVLLAPEASEASEASKGAFYLCPGFKWLLLCVREWLL